MATSKAQQAAQNRWIAKTYDRVNLALKKDESPTKAETQAAADAAGESLNAYIVGAVARRIEHGEGRAPKYSADSGQPPENTAGIDAARQNTVQAVQPVDSPPAAPEAPEKPPEATGDVIVHLSPEQYTKAEKAAKKCGQSLSAWLAGSAYRSLCKLPVAMLDDDIAALAVADADVRGVSLDAFVSTAVREYQRCETAKHKKAVAEAAQKGKRQGKAEKRPAHVDPMVEAVKQAGARRQQKRRAEINAAEVELIASMPAPDKDETAELKKRFMESVNKPADKNGN